MHDVFQTTFAWPTFSFETGMILPLEFNAPARCTSTNKREKDNSTVQRLTDSWTAYFGCFRVLKKGLERGQVTEFEFGLLACFCKLYRHRRCCTDPSVGRRAHAASGCSLNFRMVAELRLTRRTRVR